MRIDLRNKIINLSLMIFGVVLLLFVIIFNCIWFIDVKNNVVDISFGLSFALPLLSSAICFLAAGYFKSFTKDDAIRQIEKQYKNGVIGTDHYKKSLKELEFFELEKNKLKAEIEIEKEVFKKKLYEKAKKEVEGLKKNVKEKEQEQD